MNDPLIAQLTRTAAPAILPIVPSDAQVRMACLAGAVAAHIGSHLPLFVLLDTVAFFSGDARPDVVEANRHHGEDAGSYALWLARFMTMVESRRLEPFVTAPARRGDAAPRELNRAIVAMLAHEWPGPAPRRASDQGGWGAAYERLARTADPDATRARRDVIAALRTAEVAHSMWEQWWSEETPATSDARVAAIWAQFVTAHPEAFLHEQFDHAAAGFYLAASDWDDPTARTDDYRLLQRRIVTSGRQLPTSIELPARYDGLVSVDTLAKGEYGEHLLVNRLDIRLADFPRANPPETIYVHLCWHVCYHSLVAHRQREYERRNNPLAARRAPRAVDDAEAAILPRVDSAKLQGLAALVLDDLRAALTGLNVELALHRFWQSSADAAAEWRVRSVKSIKPGMRWKKALETDAGRPPPASVVGHLFHRCDHVELARQASVAHDGIFDSALQPSFWIAAVLREDLKVLGFNRCTVDDPRCRDADALTAGRIRLPAPVKHVVVVDAETNSSRLFRVIVIEKHQHLVPAGAECLQSGEPAFRSTRRAVVELVLQTISSM